MKTFIAAAFVLFAILLPLNTTLSQVLVWPDKLPVYDHVVVIIEENKDYEEIIGSDADPYINMLRSEGANFTQMYAEEHKSEGNYFWLMSGSNQNVGFSDATPKALISESNLGEQLIKKGFTFRGYAEDLPEIGSMIAVKNLYARKHVPWVSFSNLPAGNNPDSSTNLQFSQFPSDFSKLPTVSFVAPNLIDDMHNDPNNVKHGDEWLHTQMDLYYQWAKTHNSLLIVTFDENEDTNGMTGLTDPSSSKKVMQNRIPTIFAGAHIKHGDYSEGKGITHVSILRTLEAMYGLEKSGAQQPNALNFGIGNEFIITDIFTK
ncbi:MAG: alkaline phosphatase family protein [Bacteroidota bacterium]